MWRVAGESGRNELKSSSVIRFPLYRNPSIESRGGLTEPAAPRTLPHIGGIVRDDQWANSLNRRTAFRAMAAFLAGSPLLRAQQDPFRDHSRVPGLNELNTVFDFEPVAYAKVPRYNYDYTAYGVDSEFTLRRNREAFDWVDLIPKRDL